ncbi:MAG: insulinase family protein [Leptolinea sp.]|nr:insulinase family protein [Leptolinea sp.]
MTNHFFESTLSNGLMVRLKEIHTSPIISHWIWYRVGSRNEIPGKTGLSHWVEHMQFKGTPGFPASILDKAISRDGGFWNAFTYLDWTTFFETLPAEKIELALKLEADRMVNSIYDPEEVESERTVIISEREGSENEPLFRLSEAVQSAAFSTHPYRMEIIGSKDDLFSIQRDDLYKHYRTHYCPANAVLAMAGDFDTDEMFKRIQDIYGIIPTHELVRHDIPGEKEPSGEQRVDVSGPGETEFVQIAYRAPSAADPDFFAFTVMDSLLTGPSGLNMFGGGGISNKTSRLYRALIDNELAVTVSGGLQATIDPFLYEIMLTLRNDRPVEHALEVIDAEIDNLISGTILNSEIDRAVKQARALFAYGSENITNQAFWLGYSEMFANYAWFEDYVKKLEEVTPESLKAAARKYLKPENRVIGFYHAENGTGEPG